MINVTVWNEFIQELNEEPVTALYPHGIHEYLKGFLGTNEDMNIRTATLKEPEHGLTDEVLESTDVLIWWAHVAHNDVSDEVVRKISHRVLEGMGVIFLHSSHFSKPFQRLMGTTGSLRWRERDDHERLWVIAPNHPIAKGLGEYVELDIEEMYGERFDVPKPDEIVFISWFSGGEVLRSGCCWNRGSGKVFYFQPGHESHPTYHHPEIQKIITNAVRWAAPINRKIPVECPHILVSAEDKYNEGK